MTIYEKQGRRYIPRPDLEYTQHLNPHALIIGAVRYYLGRSTIAAACFAQYELPAAWDHLPAGTRSIIQREVEEEFRRDDEARAEGQAWRPLGWDCDRAAWAVLRQKWRGKDAPLASHIPTKKELIYKLRLLAEQMQEVGSAMEYLGGFDGHLAEHGKEMFGAGLIAKGWADGIEEEMNQ